MDKTSIGVGQITIVDTTDYNLTIIPDNFFIPTKSNLIPTNSGSQTVKIDLKDSDGVSLDFGIIAPQITSTNITVEYNEDENELRFSYLNNKSIVDEFIYNFEVEYNNIRIPASVVITANKQGADGTDGREIVKTTRYYIIKEIVYEYDENSAQSKMVYPSKPELNANGIPLDTNWTKEEPSSLQHDYGVWYIDIYQYNRADENNILYSSSDVHYSGSYDYIFKIENTAEGNKALIDLIGQKTADGGSFVINENTFEASKQNINLTAKNISLTSEDYNLIANQIVQQASNGSNNFSTFLQNAEGFGAWVADNTSDGQSITNALTFGGEGLRLSQKGDDVNGKYSVLITNTGLEIQRLFETISRFRKEQLTINNIRVASPKALEDNANRIIIQKAPDGGVMFVSGTAIEE